VLRDKDYSEGAALRIGDRDISDYDKMAVG